MSALIQPAPRFIPKAAAPEAFALWALCFLAIVVTYVTVTPYAKLVATAGFLYLPLWAMRRRGEDYRDYGVSLRAWKQDLKLFAILFAIILPVFSVAYVGFSQLLAVLPPGLS